MTDALKITRPPDEALRAFLAFLLQSGKAGAVLSLDRMGEDNALIYSLITEVEELDSAVPLLPMMPSNAGKLLAELTELSPSPEPIAAVLKPCELRALVELRKLNQAHLENLLLISFTCGGVLPLAMRDNGGVDEKMPQFRDALAKGEIADGIRPTCRACEHPVPSGADLTVVLVGEPVDDGTCTFLINSERGGEALEGFEGERTEVKPDSDALEALQTRRTNEARDLCAASETAAPGLDGLISIFGRCLSCRGCSTVCPICYCELCYFSSSVEEPNPSKWEAQLRHRRAVRVPPGTVRFHIGRMMHMAVSCVGCGMCSDVCPVGIPVATLFSMVGRSAGDVFSYVAGRDLEEDLPLTKFEVDELTHIGQERIES
jgi:formate dehydrogenase (coenzyme F420) beta subunit